MGSWGGVSSSRLGGAAGDDAIDAPRGSNGGVSACGAEMAEVWIRAPAAGTELLLLVSLKPLVKEPCSKLSLSMPGMLLSSSSSSKSVEVSPPEMMDRFG